jgi:hypothetical protein
MKSIFETLAALGAGAMLVTTGCGGANAPVNASEVPAASDSKPMATGAAVEHKADAPAAAAATAMAAPTAAPTATASAAAAAPPAGKAPAKAPTAAPKKAGAAKKAGGQGNCGEGTCG